MEKTGITSSKLIKTCMRFYIAYHPSTEPKELKPSIKKKHILKVQRVKTIKEEALPLINDPNSIIARTMSQLNSE